MRRTEKFSCGFPWRGRKLRRASGVRILIKSTAGASANFHSYFPNFRSYFILHLFKAVLNTTVNKLAGCLQPLSPLSWRLNYISAHKAVDIKFNVLEVYIDTLKKSRLKL